MPSQSHNLLDYLRKAAGAWRDDLRDDAALLGRFAEDGDEAAFRALVWRHGLLVWQTCRHILGDTPDAEDTFQTTFIALARKAGHLRRESLAGWLHRVARRAALNAQASGRRRRSLEQQLAAIKQSGAKGKDAEQAELYAVLDEELAGLPERLRVPLLLHFLEGKSQDEVARIVGCTRGMVRRRLARGEAVLRRRLKGRGLMVGIGVSALLTSPGVVSGLPARLIGSTSRAAAAFRSGNLAGGAAEATQAVLGSLPSSLAGTILRKSFWIALACSLALTGTVLVFCRALSGRPDETDGADAATAPTLASPGAAARVDYYLAIRRFRLDHAARFAQFFRVFTIPVNFA